MHLTLPGQMRQELGVIRRVTGQHGDPRDTGCPIGMALERRIPEVRRIVMPAGEEPRIRHQTGAGEGQRERHNGVGTVGTASVTLERKGLEIPDARIPKLSSIVNGWAGGKGEHPKPFGSLQIVVDENRERELMRIRVDRTVEVRTGRNEFEKRVAKLHNVVFGSPRVAVTRSDLKAKTAEKGRLPVEIPGGENHMVDAADME